MEIDPTNVQCVGVANGGVLIFKPPGTLTSIEAKVFAAWLILMAEVTQQPCDPSFEAILDKVKDT